MQPDVSPCLIADKAGLGRQLSALHARHRLPIKSLARKAGYSDNGIRNLLKGKGLPRDLDQFGDLVRAMGADDDLAAAFIQAVQRVRQAGEPAPADAAGGDASVGASSDNALVGGDAVEQIGPSEPPCSSARTPVSARPSRGSSPNSRNALATTRAVLTSR